MRCMEPHPPGTLLRVNESGANLYLSLTRLEKLSELEEADFCIVFEANVSTLSGVYYNILTPRGQGWMHSAWLDEVTQ